MKRYLKVKILILIGLLQLSCKESNPKANVEKTDAKIEMRVVASNLNHVWELIQGTDSQIWFTERNGKISKLDVETGTVKEIANLDEVESRGEGGLLGLALHPDFNSVPEVFVVYNYQGNGGYKEKVVKYRYDGNTLTNPVILLDNIAASSIHNGSRLLISADKKLFVTTGDAANQSTSQSMGAINGKVLRINLDGSIPSDNPDPSSAVWSFGHRNAQGLAFGNGKLYSSEHGASSDDEMNIIEKGRNYGWPNVEGMCNLQAEQTFCTANNVVEPIYTWTPTVAVCGLAYYNHDLIPQWKNSLILATLKESTLYLLKLNTQGETIEDVNEITSAYGRLRAVCVAADGKVYFSTSNGGDDKIIEISAL
jgi:aldose sugar dehydrogenase